MARSKCGHLENEPEHIRDCGSDGAYSYKKAGYIHNYARERLMEFFLQTWEIQNDIFYDRGEHSLQEQVAKNTFWMIEEIIRLWVKDFSSKSLNAFQFLCAIHSPPKEDVPNETLSWCQIRAKGIVFHPIVPNFIESKIREHTDYSWNTENLEQWLAQDMPDAIRKILGIAWTRNDGYKKIHSLVRADQ